MNKNLKKIFYSVLASAATAPVLVSGQVTENLPGQRYSSISDIFNAILKPVYIVAAGLAVLMVLIAGILFITANGNPDQVAKARQALIWAIAGLVVAILAFSVQMLVQAYF